MKLGWIVNLLLLVGVVGLGAVRLAPEQSAEGAEPQAVHADGGAA